jgi:hypothetical protein
MNQIVPLTSDPNQTLQVALSINGTTRTFTLMLHYNEEAGYWEMTVIDPGTLEALIQSLPLLTGDYPAANILGQYGYLGIGSAYIINATGIEADHPGVDNLGTDFVLVWGDANG